MSSKIDKDMLKDPDIFISTSDHIFNYVEKHFKTVVALFCVGVIAALGYVGYGYFQSSREHKAAEALYQPEAALKKAENEAQESRAKQMQAALTDKDKSKKIEPLGPINYTKDYAPLVEKIKHEISGHADTKAALVSALNLSYFLAQQKQFAEALALLELPKYRPSAGELLGGFWYMHRGLMMVENGQLDPALEAYQSVINSTALKPFHPEAMLKLGVCFELKGNAIKARETYEKLSREFPDTEASTTAKQYLRLLELKAQKQG